MKARAGGLEIDEDAKAIKAETEAYLKSHGMHLRFGGFHNCYDEDWSIEHDDDDEFGNNPEAAAGFEAMHGFELGVLKEIPKFLQALIVNSNGVASHILRDPMKKKDKNGKDEPANKVSVNCQKLLNTRIRSFKSKRLDSEGDTYLPTFSEASSLSWLRAADHKYLCQMYMVSISEGLEFFKPKYAGIT